MGKLRTRRMVLGTLIGALALGPFVLRALRRSKSMEFGEDSYLAQFRAKYQKAIDFPREFKPFINKQLALQPQQVIDKIVSIYKRRAENFFKLDEAEFDFTSHQYDKSGTKMPGNFFMDAHVKLKYGYGMEIKGKDVKGTPIHWVFNLDGDVTVPVAQKMNLSSMMLSFFDIDASLPEGMNVCGIVAENIDLPENPYIEGTGKYDCVEGYKASGRTPRVTNAISGRAYFSRNTGMRELSVTTDIPDHCNQKYLDESIPLPPLMTFYRFSRYTKVDGIYLPVETATMYQEPNGGKLLSQTYSNIKVKLR